MRVILVMILICLAVVIGACAAQNATDLKETDSTEESVIPQDTTAVMCIPHQIEYFGNGYSILKHPNYLEGGYIGLGSYGWSDYTKQLSLSEKEILTRNEIRLCLNDSSETAVEINRKYRKGQLVSFSSLSTTPDRGSNPKVIFFPENNRFRAGSEVDEEVRAKTDEMINNEDFIVVYIAIGVHEGLWRSAEIYYFDRDRIILPDN